MKFYYAVTSEATTTGKGGQDDRHESPAPSFLTQEAQPPWRILRASEMGSRVGRPVARSRPPNRGCLLRLGQAPEAYAYAVEKFAVMGRIFDPSLEKATDDVAAEKSCDVLDGFLKEIDIGLSLKGLGVREEEVVLIADHSQVLPDYKNNPRVATRDEIYEILMNSYQRE